MFRLKSIRLLDPLWVLAGAMAGVFVSIITVWNGPDEGPNAVEFVLTYRQPPQPGGQAVLEVEVLRVWRYTKTAPDPQAFDTELTILSFGPTVVLTGLMVGIGSACGALAGRWFGRWRKAREPKPTSPAAVTDPDSN